MIGETTQTVILLVDTVVLGLLIIAHRLLP